MARQSVALKLVKHVWDHNREGTGFSWERLNQSMAESVTLAIRAGLKFGKDDFQYMWSHMRIGRWCGADSGEHWYCLAIEMAHPSAIAAYEQWRGRKPFLIQPTANDKTRMRLHIGAHFGWPDKSGKPIYVKVTSFSKDQGHVVACTYKEPPEPPAPCKKCNHQERQYFSSTIARRFKITHQDIKDYHAAISKACKEQGTEPDGECITEDE